MTAAAPELLVGLANLGRPRRLMGELAGLDAGRLRVCARSECTLIFYDTTRSRTQRWHAEDPCGWRERQRTRRARTRRSRARCGDFTGARSGGVWFVAA